MSAVPPYISVVIPSRNRPRLLRAAVESVLGQSFTDTEVILVNDGTDEEYLPDLNALVDEYADRLNVIHLRRYPRGHGQSYALNSGVLAARGHFCTFLDDDDIWTDKDHLSKVRAAFDANPDALVYYANQIAVSADETQGELIWLGDMEGACRRSGLRREAGVYRLNVDLLMQSRGFGHLNCSVINRELFLRIGGLDEDIRWECDRDFYLRTIDQVDSDGAAILFNPDVVSRHHVPNKDESANMSTAISVYQRLNYQLYLLNKAAMLASNPAIVKHVRTHKAYVLQHLAEHLVAQGRWSEAAYFCWQALFMTRSLKWPFYTLGVAFRALVTR